MSRKCVRDVTKREKLKRLLYMLSKYQDTQIKPCVVPSHQPAYSLSKSIPRLAAKICAELLNKKYKPLGSSAFFDRSYACGQQLTAWSQHLIVEIPIWQHSSNCENIPLSERVAIGIFVTVGY